MPYLLPPKYLTTVEILSLNLMIAYVQFSHSLLIRLAIIADLSIMNNTSLDVFAKGPNYCEPQFINWKRNFKLLMNPVEYYVRQWAKREKEDIDTLVKYVKSVRSLIQIRRNNSMVQWAIVQHRSVKTLMLPKTCLTSMTNMLPSNIVCVLKSHYIDCLIKELGIDNYLVNLTYTATTLTKEEIMYNHRAVWCLFGIWTKDEELNLPSLYWIPKSRKSSYKQR